MQILPFEASMATDVAFLYNELLAPVSHCRSVGSEVFADVEALRSENCTREVILVAKEDGAIRGFVHVGVAKPATKDWMPQGEPGVIRFLSCRPGERAVGAALLEAAEEWARAQGRQAILAWHMMYTYPFYCMPHAQLPQRLVHILGLFGKAGYSPMDWSEIFLEWRDFVVPSLSVPDGLDIQVTPNSGRRPWQEQTAHELPGMTVTAKQDGTFVGDCVMLYLEDEWCFCDQLGVTEPLQGHGYGKYLLLRALDETRKVGCRHAMISTGGTNYRAQLCYANLGYRLVEWTVAMRKELQDKQI